MLEKLANIKTEKLPALALYCLALALVYSYVGTNWVYTISSVKKSANTSSPVYMFLTLLAIILVVVSTFILLRRCNVLTCVYIVAMVAIVFAYSAVTIFDEGVYRWLYAPTSIIAFLLQLGFFLGQNEEVWKPIRKAVGFLSVFFLVLCVYETLQISIRFGVVPVGNSSMIFYYVAAFWLNSIDIAEKLIEKRKVIFFDWIRLTLLIILALIMNSRSWIIQSILLFIVIYLFQENDISIIKKIWIIVSLAIVGYVIFSLIVNYLPGYVEQILNKIGTDSRSYQYRDILDSTKWYEWILGKGLYATYQDSRHGGAIGSIDNQYLYIAFHYGIVTLILCIVGYFQTIFKKNCYKNKQLWAAKMIIIMWLMALGGLSVFNAIYGDVKSFAMSLYAGHVFNMLNKRSGEYNYDENTLFRPL